MRFAQYGTFIKPVLGCIICSYELNPSRIDRLKFCAYPVQPHARRMTEWISCPTKHLFRASLITFKAAILTRDQQMSSKRKF